MFNHYARLKKIIYTNPDYRILLINEPTVTQNFSGQKVHYDHYYRLIKADGTYIKYGKFQQMDRLALTLNTDISTLEAKLVVKPPKSTRS